MLSQSYAYMYRSAFQKLKEQRDCHKEALELVDRLQKRIPVTGVIHVQDQDEGTKEALKDLVDLIKKAFLALQEYVDAPFYSKFIL